MRLILLLAALLLLPAPALASEREDARRVAEAMRPLLDALPAAVTQAEADRQARAQVVVDTCADTIRTALERKRRAVDLEITYLFYTLAPLIAYVHPLHVAADERIALLQVSSPLLRRAAVARARMSAALAWPELGAWDLCASLASWQQSGWKRAPLDQLGEPDGQLRKGDVKVLARAAKVLRRHGATREETNAFLGDYPVDGLARDDPAMRLFKELSGAPEPTRG